MVFGWFKRHSELADIEDAQGVVDMLKNGTDRDMAAVAEYVDHFGANLLMGVDLWRPAEAAARTPGLHSRLMMAGRMFMNNQQIGQASAVSVWAATVKSVGPEASPTQRAIVQAIWLQIDRGYRYLESDDPSSSWRFPEGFDVRDD